MVKMRRMRSSREHLLGPLVFISISALFAAVLWWLGTSKEFRVASIEVSPGYRLSEELERDILGKNIFRIKLQNIKARIARRNPEIEEIIIMRIPPATIKVELYMRKPFLQIKMNGSPLAVPSEARGSPLTVPREAGGSPLTVPREAGGYLPVDKEGFVLSPPRQTPLPALPVVFGLETAAEKVKAGKYCLSSRLALAVRILEEKGRINTLDDYPIVSLDVARLKDASFLLANGIKVNVGGEKIATRLTRPAFLQILWQGDLAQVKYIDLRFRDVTIKER